MRTVVFHIRMFGRNQICSNWKHRFGTRHLETHMTWHRYSGFCCLFGSSFFHHFGVPGSFKKMPQVLQHRKDVVCLLVWCCLKQLNIVKLYEKRRNWVKSRLELTGQWHVIQTKSCQLGRAKQQLMWTERLQKSIHTNWHSLPLLNSPDKQIQIYIHFVHALPCFGEVIC